MTPARMFLAAVAVIVLAALATYLTGRPPPASAVAEGVGSPSLTDWMQGVSAVATLAFTGVLTVVSIRQWRVAEKSASAASTSAEIAKLALLASHRPELRFELVQIEEREAVGRFELRHGCSFSNIGEQVARLLLVELYIGKPKDVLDQTFFETLTRPGHHLTIPVFFDDIPLPPNTTHNASGSHTSDKRVGPEASETTWIVLVARYTDGLGVTRTQSSSYLWNPLFGLRPNFYGRFNFERIEDYGPLTTS